MSASITVKNKLKAPIVINVPEQSALYFGPRETKVIDAAQFQCTEMQEQIAAGNIILLRME